MQPSCRFLFVCQLTWDELTPIEDESDVRFCGICRTQVHLVWTEEEFEAHARDQHCVAWAPPESAGGNYGVTLGVPIIPETPDRQVR